MAWRDELQAAQFRGVMFYVNRAEIESGRRVVEHEYPQRDVPFAEDLGRKARTFTLEAFVLGADYLLKKDALLNACEQVGPGELIHPYYGSRNVVCVSVRIREAIDDGGVARFTLTFNEAGAQRFPIANLDLVVAVNRQAKSAWDDVATQFAQTFNVLQQPQFVLAQAVDEMNNTTKQLEALANRIINPVADSLQQLNDFQRSVEQLMATPARMAGRFQQTVQALTGTSEPRHVMLNALIEMATPQQNTLFNPVPIKTASRQQAAQNTQALTQLVQGTALIEAARLSTDMANQGRFDSHEDALNMQKTLLALFDTLAFITDDQVFLSLQTLRHGFSSAVPSPAVALPRLVVFTPAQTLPALMIAHTIYGDATKASQIIQRNKIKHPGFIEAGVNLEILVSV